ncbi:MAG: YkgJ family cysteine cluster protein [Mangrovibacterium sp.]
MAASKYPEYDPLFYKDGYQLGIKAGSEPLNEKLLWEALETMYRSVDQLIESLLALGKRQGVKVDCRAGCSWCCYQPVFANTYEIGYLARYIRKNFNGKQQQKIYRRAMGKNSRLSGMKEEELLYSKHACPLLDKDSCSAYPARPMACRIYLSIHKDSCHRFYRDPENTESKPELLDFPLQAGRIMNEGFFAALKETGLASSELRLEEGLIFFMDPGRFRDP